ncbi:MULTISPECIES: peroxiredoxin [Prochlorococcus]|uniref:peroxiredoxin n=1 Tax=Prochlorococcus TaxID=1218 RepID=UPI000533A704|nr:MULTISPECIES: peroxiredoxin [Prochlorococcus]KGG14139.1 Alkyl hydroperoxide reductase subunit C-like protein [Prochlorococcus sp. MIT 0601]
MSLDIGEKIPYFSLADQEGKQRSNKDIKGKPLVLFFYPKDDTPGCTAEACGFRDKYDLFQIFGAVVWGVSNDSQDSHRKFADKNKLPFPLLCDEDNSLRKQFGVPKVLGLIDGRVTFIMDSEGIIRYVFNDLLNGPQHVTEALRVLENIR